MAQRWQDSVELIGEIGIGATRTQVGTDVWDTGRWDTALWSGLEPLWVEIPCERISGAAIRGGRENVWDSFDAGTATLTFADEDDRFTIWNPDLADEQLELRPGTPLRISALFEGVRYPLFRGYVEIITERITGTDVITVELAAQDALGQLARVDLLERPAVGANDLTHERVARLLDAALWPAEWRNLDHTTVRHQATTLAQPTIEELLLVVWTEGGAIYADRYGDVRLRSRIWLIDDPLSTTVQRVVGNVDGVCPAEIEWSRAADYVVNDIALARVGGTAVTARDDDSVSRMGLRSWHRFDLSCVDDEPVISRAELLLNERSEGRVRIDSIVIDAEAIEDWPFILAVDYGWRLQVLYEHPIYGWTLDIPVFVQQIQYSITSDGWQLTLGVDDVAPFTPIIGRWDGSRWDDERALWS